MKSSAKLDSLFVNIHLQLYVHLKKWTLKFKLLYLLNHISYFNKILLDMVTKYSNTKSDSLAQISTPMAETQNFF